MYVSSDGTEKDVRSLNTEYLINAFAKSSREIFSTQNLDDYNKYLNNIQNLYNELVDRYGKYLADKLNDEGWTN